MAKISFGKSKISQHVNKKMSRKSVNFMSYCVHQQINSGCHYLLDGSNFVTLKCHKNFFFHPFIFEFSDQYYVPVLMIKVMLIKDYMKAMIITF